MARLPVPDDHESGHISVAGTDDLAPRTADVQTDAVDHARDLSVREDEQGRYVGVSDHYAADVAAYLGVDAPSTDEDGGDADETESGSDDEQTSGEDSDAEPDSGTCDAVKTDGEVCGRELPCPYHSDEEGSD